MSREPHPYSRRGKPPWRKPEGIIERKVESFLESLRSEPTPGKIRRSQRFNWRDTVRYQRRQKLVRHARLFHIRYGNLMLVAIGLVVGVWLIQNPDAFIFLAEDPKLGLIGAFVLGLFYPVGVTTPASIAGFYLLGKSMDPLLLAGVGTAGALVVDVMIFYFIRHKLIDYLDRFASRFTKTNIHLMRMRVQRHPSLRHFVPLFAGILIASPLPTEIAIGIFAVMKFDMKRFMIYAFAFHLVSIYIVSQLGASYHLA